MVSPFLSFEDGCFEVQRYDSLPMWGTMWQFGDSADDYWLEELSPFLSFSSFSTNFSSSINSFNIPDTVSFVSSVAGSCH